MLKADLLVLNNHGAAWYGAPQAPATPTLVPENQSLLSWGYRTDVVNYRTGYSLSDTIHAYDRSRRSWKGPICALGLSAGGNIAMVLAMHRHLQCVVSEQGPTDLTANIQPLAESVDVFFPTPAEKVADSPALHPLTSPTLVTEVPDDPIVPPSQGEELSGAAHFAFGPSLGSNPEVCTSNEVFFVHSCVATSQYRRYLRVLHRFVSRAGRA
jgi:hypothetical protein